jgi:hypothetical protein
MIYIFVCLKFNDHELVWMAIVLDFVLDIIPSLLRGSVDILCNFRIYSKVLMFQHRANILPRLVMVI